MVSKHDRLSLVERGKGGPPHFLKSLACARRPSTLLVYTLTLASDWVKFVYFGNESQQHHWCSVGFDLLS